MSSYLEAPGSPGNSGEGRAVPFFRRRIPPEDEAFSILAAENQPGLDDRRKNGNPFRLFQKLAHGFGILLLCHFLEDSYGILNSSCRSGSLTERRHPEEQDGTQKECHDPFSSHINPLHSRNL